MERKILICGGGTAGHVYPATAIMEYIKNYYPDSRLLFVGQLRHVGSILSMGFLKKFCIF